jgi:hypothetical protein
MARLIHLSLKIAQSLARTLGWDYWGFARREEGFDHTLIGVECFIGQQVSPFICGKSTSAP